VSYRNKVRHRNQDNKDRGVIADFIFWNYLIPAIVIRS